jgi:PAS domain-containing protein
VRRSSDARRSIRNRVFLVRLTSGTLDPHGFAPRTKKEKERKDKMAFSFDDILGGNDACMSLLRLLAENSFDSILITDTSSRGRIVYTNKAFKKLTGYGASDVIGKTPRVL